MINGILKKLQDTPAVTAYVPAGRILPLVQMQGDVVPAILVDLEGVRTNESKSATSRNDDNDVAVVVVSESAKQAYQIASACRDALDGFAGASDGVQIAECRFVNWATDEADGGRLFILSSAYTVATMRGGATAIVSGTVPTASIGSLTVQETSAANSDTANTLEFPEGSVTHDSSDKATISMLQGVITEYGAAAGLTDSMFPNGLFGDIDQSGTVGTGDLLAVLGNFGASASPSASELTQSLSRAKDQMDNGDNAFFSTSRNSSAQTTVTALTNAGHVVEYFEGINSAQGRGFISNYLADTVADSTVRRTMYISGTPFPTGLSQMQQYPLGPYDNQTQTFIQAVVDAYINSITANGSVVILRTVISSTPNKLLDTYTGAAAAYSVRLLDKDYSGSCMRIRRDSDDSETDIGFDSSGDLDTSAIATHCGSANGYVVTWYDQSGNTNNATQSTSSRQPQIYNGTAVSTENGKPCMSCVAPRYLSVNSGATQPFTQHIVCNPGTTSPLFAYGEPLMLRYDSGGSTRYHDGSFRQPSPSFTSASGDQNHNMLFYYGATTGYAVQNQSSHQEDASVNFGVLRGATLSLGGKLTSGNIAALQEFVIWDNDQYSNRSGIETDTNDYFNIY